MKRNIWLQTLNIRSEEGWLVKKLFLLQFFQGAGIAFFFTASFALFLTRFPINEMPWVFIYSSFLLWATGFIYSRIEHKFNINKLAIVLTVFMVFSMLLFRLMFDFIRADWFLYWMLAWYNVLYLLNNLEFWGVAALLFDTRQSKRLFGVISAGDIPAKFIGYSLALLTVSYIGTINLLWAGMACMLASIPFLVSISKSAVVHDAHHDKKHQKVHTVEKVTKIVKHFSGNVLIRRLATLSIIVTGSFIVINFAFYAGVKEENHDDVALAKFIAFFMAIVRLMALVVKLIFTGRLINKLGITKSLLITPIALLVLISGIILTHKISGHDKMIIYLFGATSIIVEILRSSINSPVFLTIMQPLSHHERLRAHTIVKGVMDPFASLVAGVMLLLLIRYEEKVDLLTLSYILGAVCVLWIIGIYRVNSQYLKTIIKTISSRYFNQESFSINDARTLEWLKQKAITGTETEVTNILSMLVQGNHELPEGLLVTLLQHPSDRVKLMALKFIHQHNLPKSATYLMPLVQQNQNPLIVAESISIMCRNGVENQVIAPYLEHQDPFVRQAALAGVFFYGTGEMRELAENNIRQLLGSSNEKDRLEVAEILSGKEQCAETAMIRQLMNDDSPSVRKKACLAAGKSANKQLLRELMGHIDADENIVMQSLYVSGNLALPIIHEFITAKNASRIHKEKLVQLCGRIGGDHAHEILTGLLTSNPEEYMHVIKALYRSNFYPPANRQELYIDTAKKLLARSACIIYMQNSLEPMRKQYQLLINSFNLELDALRESLLYLFAILYGRENINKVRTAYATRKKESIINAMEIIDITVRKDIADQFNTIFEPGDIMERMHDLRKIYPVEFFDGVELILERVLEEERQPYENWTMACSLYTSKKEKLNLDHTLIGKYTRSENELVRETALFAM